MAYGYSNDGADSHPVDLSNLAAKQGRPLRMPGRVRRVWHGIWWRMIWFLRLGKPYQEGICGYCGKAHGRNGG